MGTGTRCVLAPLLAASLGLCLAVLASRADGAGHAGAARGVPPALELYALETELAETRDRMAALATERRKVAADRTAARLRLRLAQDALATAQRRLAQQVHGIYTAGDPEPLAVVLGATSLDEAQASLDALERSAVQSEAVGRQARRAGRDVGRLIRSLARRERALAALEADARARGAALAAAVERRRAYLAEVTRRRGEAVAASVARVAASARRRSEALTAAAQPALLATAPLEQEPAIAVRGVRRLTVDAVAYSLPGRTASGLPVGPGVVAVDPAVIPLGTRMEVPGYGPAIAADVGTAVQGLVIDLWFPTLAEARAWGRRTVTITLRS